MAGRPFARHDLVRVSPDDWRAALARSSAVAAADDGTRALLAGWAAAGRPAVVRRRSEGDAPDVLLLGLPLPPCHGKLRIALSLADTAAVTRVAPSDLAAALATAPATWAGILRALGDLGAEVGVAPRLFGSLLWATVTGLDYVAPSSDLDLLWPVTPATDLPRLLAGLERIGAMGIVPLDGEILLPDGAGLQWRELARALRDPDGRVLAKTVDGVSLRRAEGLFGA